MNEILVACVDHEKEVYVEWTAVLPIVPRIGDTLSFTGDDGRRWDATVEEVVLDTTGDGPPVYVSLKNPRLFDEEEGPRLRLVRP